MLQFLVAAEGFTHIKGVFARFSASRVVAIVADHAAENAVSVPPSRRPSVSRSLWKESVSGNVP